MLENWYDLASDLSAFHRIDDPEQIAPQRLIDLAVRIQAYSGAVSARRRADVDDSEVPTYDGGPDAGVREVEPTQAAILVDPILGSLIEWG